MKTKNNRSFFRIDAMIPCGYKMMTKKQSEKNPIPTSLDSSYIEEYFLEGFHELDEQIKEITVQISQKSHLLSQALTALNSKINFLMQTVDYKQLARTIPVRMVNLSAGGLAFKINEHVDLSCKVDILIQPIPDQDPILARCNIVKIVSETDGSTTISLEYQDLSEDDRRKLVYFIQSKEIEYANKQRTIADYKPYP